MESLFATSCLVPETPTLEWSFGETTISQRFGIIQLKAYQADGRGCLQEKSPLLLEVLDIGPDVQI